MMLGKFTRQIGSAFFFAIKKSFIDLEMRYNMFNFDMGNSFHYDQRGSIRKDGGPGSGNWGHAGVPGKVGGSAKGGGKSKKSSEKSQKQKQYEAKLDQEKASVLAMKPNKQALALKKAGYLSHNDAVALMKNGKIEESVEKYYKILKENGDSTPDKPISEQLSGELAMRVRYGEFKNYNDAREVYISEMTGMKGREVSQTNYELQNWFGGSWKHADTKVIDNYIEKDHAYEGEIHRGLHFETKESYDTFMKTVSVPGKVIRNTDGKNSSWSSNEETARGFAHTVDGNVNSVVIHCLKNRTSAPVNHISTQGEDEVLAHSKAQWTVLRTKTEQVGRNTFNTEVYVIEKGEYDV